MVCALRHRFSVWCALRSALMFSESPRALSHLKVVTASAAGVNSPELSNLLCQVVWGAPFDHVL